MTYRKAHLSVAISLVLTIVFPALAAGATASESAGSTKWVRPVKDNVVVVTSTGTKVERIGILTKDTVVQVLREDRDWYQVKFTRENAEFVGWVPREEMAVEGTPPDPPKRNPKPEPAPGPKPDAPPEEQKLSLQETHTKLMELVQIPLGSSPMWKRQYNLSRMKTYRQETGSTGMALFSGGAMAKLDALYLFDPDEVIEVFVDDKIRELKKLRKEGHPDFTRIIDSYIRALEAYIEGKFPDLRRLVQQAERFWGRIPGVVVGF